MEAAVNAVAKAKPLVGTALEAGGNVIKSNPKAVYAISSVGVGAAVTSGLVVPVLGAVGFAATGPVASSIAATYQSSVGIITAGSWFATLQSAAMGGGAAMTGVLTGAATVGGAIGGATNWAMNSLRG